MSTYLPTHTQGWSTKVGSEYVNMSCITIIVYSVTFFVPFGDMQV